MKERIISAVVALLITIPLLLLGGIYFKLLVLILGILGLREMINAKGSIPNMIKIISYVIFLFLMLYRFDTNILIGITFILFLPVLYYHDDKKYNMIDALYLFAVILFLSIAFNAFIAIRNSDLFIIFYLFIITITTDTFAYFGGMKFGHNKLSPTLSPNKSVEGFVIGLVFGTIIASVFYYFCISNSINIFTLIGITLLLSTIGQFGDLIFSSIKRHFNIKDFSNIMPGHGGILDRLDSAIFAILGYIFIMGII